ncbi:hypothetical protein S7711_03658 [Stachybotrys chartarum IBT 7711]|uniref:Major facilitator superfamily (MFS) profile domain-containing protein n=1 Tax=Stachybotrys chartarum (strain CBS 109288 / IBT 7711) TaxID=1280523 RepID=A0A084B7G1_STACB|nr:hypothetical protein S7711_03658 [Stachybotrys chartarum IBT 7711]KFA50106.1 hypothetical protein S40293_06385 [Stachybotrys chartarum IBT 40293]KFA80709.1 hypothetical protein S40288_01757 [Stachybotrys chartarum IBT 40288]
MADHTSATVEQEKQSAGREGVSQDGDGVDTRETGSTTSDSNNPQRHEPQHGNGNGRGDEEPTTVIDRVLSRVISRASGDPGPPPDGGYMAWLQCLACHLVVANTWGSVTSFGVFQSYYTDTLDRSASDISWIGSLATFLLFFVGTLTGRLTDAGYFRLIFATGTFLLLLGIFTTSLAVTYWQVMLSQGLSMGLGNGFLFCPIIVVLSSYFAKRRALAVGIGACGGAVGGIIYPLMVRQLLPQIGFPWTVRAIGLIQLITMGVANIIAKPRLKPRKAGPLIELSAFRELEYTFYAIGAFLNFLGLYFPYFYLTAYSREELNPPLSYTSSLNLLLLLNGVSIIGRLLPNYLADRVGLVNVFIPTSLIASILIFGWIGVRTPSALYGWSVLYGIASAGIQSLFPAALSSLTTDLQRLGVRIGMIFTIVSFATLTGPPIAGAIISSGAGYPGAQVFAGSSIALGCGFLCLAKVARMRRTGDGWRGKV